MKRIRIGGIAVSASQLDTRPSRGKTWGLVTAAILGIAIISQPPLAYAAHGGGGFRGGGFHGEGFHDSGFHGGGFNRGGVHGWCAGDRGWSGGGLGRGYAPYIYGTGYCANPAAHYSSVGQCGVPW
jgi:hypothetical protein